jgi:hypothetical protein
LAHSILHREIAENVPFDVYRKFRDDVIAELPPDGFELSARQVWDWVRANRALVDRAVFGADAPAIDPGERGGPRARLGL